MSANLKGFAAATLRTTEVSAAVLLVSSTPRLLVWPTTTGPKSSWDGAAVTAREATLIFLDYVDAGDCPAASTTPNVATYR